MRLGTHTHIRVTDAVEQCMDQMLFDTKLRQTTKFLDDVVVKVTRQRRHDKRSRQETFIVTYGRPNYAEAKALKDGRAKPGIMFYKNYPPRSK